MSIRCYDVSDPTFYFFSCFPVVMMNLHQFIHHFGQISTMSKTLPAVPDLAWFRVHDPDQIKLSWSSREMKLIDEHPNLWLVIHQYLYIGLDDHSGY